MAAFRTAPPPYAAWRYVDAEMQVMHRLGRGDEVAPRLEDITEHAPRASTLLNLLAAKNALRQAKVEEAAGAVTAAGEPDEDKLADGDVAAARECLLAELAFCEAAPVGELPEPSALDARVSAGVRAWRSRLKCRWYLEQGRLKEAGELLRQPLEWLASRPDIDRLEAVRLAFAGKNDEEAGGLFRQCSTEPGATPCDRLAWGLWLCGRGDFIAAREALQGLADALPDCLELRLAEVEVHLALGEADQAQERLDPLGELPRWTVPHRLALYRPWHGRLFDEAGGPVPAVSMHRVADILHGADLMIRAGRIDQAVGVLEMVERQLGEVRPKLDPQLAEVFRQACAAEMAKGNLHRACELHLRAAQLAEAGQGFAIQVADATSELETTPPDQVLEVLYDWVCASKVDEKALDGSPVGRALERLLHVDATTPADQLEADRRKHWTGLLAQARPPWDWPKRNLAREASRSGQHEEALRLVQSLGEPDAADHFLGGRSAWELDRFEAAEAGFSHSVEAGNDAPEARAWRGCARAAVRFQQWLGRAAAPSAADLEAILPDLDWPACELHLQPRVRLWRGAVLLAAGRAVEGIEALEVGEEADEAVRVAAKILRGLAMLAAGRHQDAVDALDPGEDLVAAVPLELSFRVLVLQHRPGFRHRREVEQCLETLRKRGVAEGLFHLSMAHGALWHGDPQAALRALEQAAKAESERPLPAPLAPLRPVMDGDRAFLEARAQMHQGHFDEAGAALASLPADFVWRDAARYWRALSLIGGSRPEEGRALLEELAQQDGLHVDAEAQLALIDVRAGGPDAAEAHARRAAEHEPDHPFALIAAAEIEEARGNVEAAAAGYRRLIEEHAAGAGDRILAAAHVALGRLHQHGQQPDMALAHYGHAVTLAPAWPVAKKRLALLLLCEAKEAEQVAEARAHLDWVADHSPDDVAAGLGRAAACHRLKQWDAVADELDRVVKLKAFGELPGPIRRAVAVWSADVQLLLKRFGAAAKALDELARQEPSPEIEERVVRCRLLDSVQRLQAVPLPDGAIEQAMLGADKALVTRPDHPLATLLATLCRILLGHGDEAEAQALAAKLESLPLENDQQRLIAALTRHLAGDERAVEEMERALAAEGHAPAARRCMKILLANQKKQHAELVAEAESILDGPEGEPSTIPLDMNDVVRVGALDCVARRREDQAVERLHKWHARGRGSDRTRLLHSQLLARRAVDALRNRRLMESRDLLVEAVKVLRPAREPAESNRE